jgi:tetratricopeptide (TPR) repeat protein
LAALTLAWGAGRYDGAQNFALRINAELQARRPHPQFAPTPWTSAPGGAGGVALALAPASPTPTPTSVSSPTRRAAPTQTATRTPAAAVSPTPSATRPPSPTPPQPTQQVTLPPTQTQLDGLRHNWQTWNNCGPATLAMQLGYFGSRLSQADVAAVLRPYRDDKNVNPAEMADYARAQGVNALVRVNGDDERLKRLLAAGVPVLIETWYEPKPNDGMGHYRLLVGYDDATREWIAYDSYDGRGLKKGAPYRGIRLPYAEVARLWEGFNRTYVVLYDDARRAAIESILGADRDDAAMWAGALEAAQSSTQTDPKNSFAWFNAGSSLLALGRSDEAAAAFDQARRVGLPWRMLWYQHGPFEAYYATGRYDEMIALANATLKNAQIEELYYWRGLAQQAKGDTTAAQASFRRALELNANYTAAAVALQSLAPAAS